MQNKPTTTTTTIATLTPAQIMNLAREWGTRHGKILVAMPEIRQALLDGESVVGLDEPDMLWDSLGYALDDLKLHDDLVVAAEEAAEEAAREAGEAMIRMRTE